MIDCCVLGYFSSWISLLPVCGCERVIAHVVSGMGHEARPEELDSVLKFLKSVLEDAP